MTATLSPSRRQYRLATIACAVAGIFFGYGFVLRVSPGVMVDELMRDFGVSALILGNLSAFYFYPYAALQIPIGLWIDRIGPRASLTSACALVAVGCFVFANATTIHSAYAGRFLIGVGCAFTWPGFLMVVHQWFPGRFAFLAGVGQFGGMAGGVVGQAPIAAAVDRIGWQSTLLLLAVVGVGLSAGLWACTRDRVTTGQHTSGAMAALRAVLGKPASWLAGAFTVSMAVQILAFGGLWGVPFVSNVYGLERTPAAGVVSIMFVGSAVGAMAFGWWSDRRGERRTPMLTASTICLAASSLVLFVPAWPLPALSVWVLVWGLGTGGIVVGFAAARDANLAGHSALSVGLVNTLVILGGAVFQLVIGYLLDLSWEGGLREGVRVYDPLDYRLALSSLTILLIAGLLCATRVHRN